MTVHLDKRLGRWRYDFWRAKRRYQDWCLNLDGTEARNKTEAGKAQERAMARAQAAPAATRRQTVTAPVLAFAMDAYVAHLSTGRHSDNQITYAAELLDWFGAEQPLAEIDGRVGDYIAWSRRQKIKVWRGGSRKRSDIAGKDPWLVTDRTRTTAVINRYLDALRKAIRLFGELPDPATGLPRLPRLPKIPKLKEASRLPRPVSDPDLALIVAHAAPWVVDAAQLARHMGFRKTEMLAIKLSQVDLHAECVWLDAGDTKANRDERVPANSIALEILARRKAEAEALGLEWLFWYIPPSAKGAPAKPPREIRSIKRAWAAAQRRAGLPHRYRFHDLKAAFVTGVAPFASLLDLQRLARHKSIDTTRAYQELAKDSGRAAVEAMANSVREKVREHRGESGSITPQKARSGTMKSRG